MPCESIAACLRLSRMGRKDLRVLAGISLRTGRTKKLAFRMRRVGAILAAHPELIERLSGLPLRRILIEAEKVGKGTRYVYG